MEANAWRALGQKFGIAGSFLSAAPFGSGHINDTYAVAYQTNGSVSRYIHQRINHHIFTDPEGLMSNIERVTRHIRAKVEESGEGDPTRNALNLLLTDEGRSWWQSDTGEYWRTYHFVENTKSYDVITSLDQAYEGAFAFGRFQAQLADLPAPRLNETLPDFHHTPKRFEALVKAVDADTHNRASLVKADIDFIVNRESFTRRFIDLEAQGHLPERITHNDTKLNNVLLDNASGKGMCVIDLDTVMPGLALYDFGDMVRTGVSPAPEDERDLAKIQVRMDVFSALAEGYLKAGRSFLTQEEIAELPQAGALITLEIGIRFLTDYLNGDIYFKTHHPDHNAERAKSQFTLVKRLEEKSESLRSVVERIAYT